jgi:outer membrane immunogenic protein
MKKNLLLAAVSLIALSAAAPALAADLAARPYTKAPAMVATIYDWSGFYIGINGGGGSAHSTWDLVGGGREGSHDATGGTVGGQIGYRWQSGQWVFGVEGQGNWADFSGDKGGAAVAGTKYDVFSTASGALLASNDQTRWGGTVGAGIEYGFAPNWSVGVEYNHIFLQDKDVTFALVPSTDRIRQDVDMGLVRLNYKFGGPIIGRY